MVDRLAKTVGERTKSGRMARGLQNQRCTLRTGLRKYALWMYGLKGLRSTSCLWLRGLRKYNQRVVERFEKILQLSIAFLKPKNSFCYKLILADFFKTIQYIKPKGFPAEYNGIMLPPLGPRYEISRAAMCVSLGAVLQMIKEFRFFRS